MFKVFKIALRNLRRYKRRTQLTLALIIAGMVFFMVFSSVTGSFKDAMVGQITESFLGHLQIHRAGYIAAIDNLPLQLNLQSEQVQVIERTLDQEQAVAAYSKRIKFGGAFSNFEETTNIRINGVDPDMEFSTCPQLLSRIVEGNADSSSLEKGKILVPELLARGLKVKAGDTVVVVATNEVGSVNGKTFVIGGILSSATGPGGRDGYIHIDDARELLRMDENGVSEFAIRIKDFDQVDKVRKRLLSAVANQRTKEGKPVFEVHTWEKLSPFSNIAKMIDVMTFFLMLMLVAVVLISIMNVMIMAVYERIREIGTIAAIGTQPRMILALFVTEGFLMGTLGTLIGLAIGLVIIFVLNYLGIDYSFGRTESLILLPTISFPSVFLISALVIFVSVVASIQPAWKASKMEPIDALRHV
ncbi:MAG: ABC transporter permease [Deltaproteobacteria bacterium]|nr:ABC transporter permease [Deltaproteobacteria bacterium]